MAFQYEEEVVDAANDLMRTLRLERFKFDNIRDYVKGTLGLPKIPENSTEEIRDLRRRSGKNILPSVVNTYTDALAVVGYANVDSEDNNPVWEKWNELNLSSVQGAVHRSVVTYGVGYLSVVPGVLGLSVRAGSPRNTTAIYAQSGDLFPRYALETWVDSSDQMHGALYDELHVYPLVFESKFSDKPSFIDIPVAHKGSFMGRPVVPVVRFLNSISADEDDAIVGDVEPLIDTQLAMNEVNFTRLLVTRYGAHPMKVITGWEAPSPEAYNAVANSVDKALSFADENVKIHTFDPADPAAYTNVLKEMLSHASTMAGLNPTTTGAGDMTNLSAEALALVDSTYRSRVRSKQTALAVSWKTTLRLIAGMSGIEDDVMAEVLWRTLDTPTIGSVGDLISKAGPQGVPVEHLVGLIPGLTPQQVRNIKKTMKNNQAFAIDAIFKEIAAAETVNE